MKVSVAMVAIALSAVSAPALAAHSVLCTNGDSASISMVLGDEAVIRPTGINISVDEKNWSSDPNASSSRQVNVGQAFEDADHVMIDLTDVATAEVLIKLRLYTVTDPTSGKIGGGTMWVKGVGAYSVTCTGL